MKKSLLAMTALAAMLFAGCTSSDEITTLESIKQAENAATPVSFGTYMGRTGTRATGGTTGDITTKVLQNSNYFFGVVAYHTIGTAWSSVKTTAFPNFMWNQKIEYSTDHWTYSPVKYWPNHFADGSVDNKQGVGEESNATAANTYGKVSFFAYAPYVEFPGTTANSIHGKDKVSQKGTPDTDGIVAMTANDYQGEPQVYYVMSPTSSTPANSVDLLWGLRGNSSYSLADNGTDSYGVGKEYNTDLTKQKAGETINFHFKHALAKLGGHNSANKPQTGDPVKSGVQIVLDIDDGSLTDGVKPGTDIFGGTKQANTLVTVQEIKIMDQASATTAGITHLTKATSDLIKEGWFNIATGVWDASTVGGTYSSTVDNNDDDNPSKEGYALNTQIKDGNPTYNPSTNKWSISSTEVTGVTTVAQDVYTDASNAPALLMIPSSTSAQTLVVSITYVVRTYDSLLANGANDDTGASKPWTKVTQTITNEVTIPANALKSNTYYKLLIHLGLTSVKFTAIVDDWDNSTSGGTNGNANTSADNDKDVYLPSNTI